MNLPEHLFLSEDGNLYDTRIVGWYKKKSPLREGYRRFVNTIRSLQHVKACLRAGPYVWPGGYPVYFMTADGEALSFAGAQECWSQIVSSYLCGGPDDGWRIAGCAINYEDQDLMCCHTNKPIEAAYGDDSSK